MVRSITSFSRSGILDWMMQRVSAAMLGAYALFMFGYFLFSGDVQYENWQALFANFWFKIFSLAALVSLVGHIWVGMWTVATDYLPNIVVRFFVLALIAFVNFVYFVVGATAVWGV